MARHPFDGVLVDEAVEARDEDLRRLVHLVAADLEPLEAREGRRRVGGVDLDDGAVVDEEHAELRARGEVRT